MISDSRTRSRVERALVSAPPAIKIIEALRAMDLPLWLVGGATRDALCGRKISDMDMVIDADPAPILERMGPRLGFSIFPLDLKRGFYRLTQKKPSIFTVDICRMHGRSIEEDLARRDFTINAMAVPLGKGMEGNAAANTAIIDPFGGVLDLEKRILRPVSDHSLEDDPLRVLRAHRLALTLGLAWAPGLDRRMTQAAGALHTVATERILMELVKIMAHPQSHKALEAMATLGILAAIFPEADLETETAREETLKTFRKLDGILEEESHASYLNEAVGSGMTRKEIVKIVAVYLHAADGDERQGSRLVSKAARRMKTPSTAARGMAAMAWGWSLPLKAPDDGALFDWIYATRDWAEGALLLARTAQTEPGRIELFTSRVRRISQRWKAAWPASSPPVTGGDVMEALGMEPGPEVGRLLREAEKAVALGKIKGREEVLAFIREIAVTK